MSNAPHKPRWQPKNTQVFVVSIAKFKNEKMPSFSVEDRLDENLVRLFKERGVPEDGIVFLKDEQAAKENIERKFNELLHKSSSRDLLIFYFSSHGKFDYDKRRFKFVTYDDTMRFDWAFDSIDRSFKGSQVLMFTDSCFSGGIVEILRGRRTAIGYACLSSTYSQNIGFSGWRFFDCLLRGFNWDPVVDLDGNGYIDLDELARFTKRHMAFVAEGYPMFGTTNNFSTKLELAEAKGKKKDPRVGQYVETSYKGQWHKAEITDLKPGHFRVSMTAKGATYHQWVPEDQVRSFTFSRFPKGARVQVKGATSEKWYLATVLQSSDSLHHCRFDGESSAHDQWVGQSRMRNVH